MTETPTMNTDSPTVNTVMPTVITDTPTVNTDSPTMLTDVPSMGTSNPTLNPSTSPSMSPTICEFNNGIGYNTNWNDDYINNIFGFRNNITDPTIYSYNENNRNVLGQDICTDDACSWRCEKIGACFGTFIGCNATECNIYCDGRFACKNVYIATGNVTERLNVICRGAAACQQMEINSYEYGFEGILTQFHLDCVGLEACEKTAINIAYFDYDELNQDPTVTCWTYVIIYYIVCISDNEMFLIYILSYIFSKNACTGMIINQERNGDANVTLNMVQFSDNIQIYGNISEEYYDRHIKCNIDDRTFRQLGNLTEERLRDRLLKRRFNNEVQFPCEGITIFCDNGWGMQDPSCNYNAKITPINTNSSCLISLISDVLSYECIGECLNSPTVSPTMFPTNAPSLSTSVPTMNPTNTPTISPTDNPTVMPTLEPTKVPTNSPTPGPSVSPTPAPSSSPTPSPTEIPTESPSISPTPSPTLSPTPTPTDKPTESPTNAPSIGPTPSPTPSPTSSPTPTPTFSPTNAPTQSPTDTPSVSPTPSPTFSPTNAPTLSPTPSPTDAPTTRRPTTSLFNTQIDVTCIFNFGESASDIFRLILEQQYFNLWNELIIIMEAAIEDPIYLKYEDFFILIPTINNNVDLQTDNNDFNKRRRLQIARLDPNDISKNSPEFYVTYRIKFQVNSQRFIESRFGSSQDKTINKIYPKIRQLFTNDTMFTVQTTSNAAYKNQITIESSFLDKIGVPVFIIILFLIIIIIVTILAGVYNKGVFCRLPGLHTTDSGRYMSLIGYGIHIFDLFSDLLISYEILSLVITYKKAIINPLDKTRYLLLSIAGIGSISFALITYITNVFIAANIKGFISKNVSAKVWFGNNATLFIALVVISGSCYNALDLVSSGIFGIEMLECGLTKYELRGLTKIKVYGSILLENIPQIVCQVLYVYCINGVITNYTYIAFVSSIFSILLVIISYYIDNNGNDSIPVHYYLQMYIPRNKHRFLSNKEEIRIYEQKGLKLELRNRITNTFGIPNNNIEIGTSVVTTQGCITHCIQYVFQNDLDKFNQSNTHIIKPIYYVKQLYESRPVQIRNEFQQHFIVDSDFIVKFYETYPENIEVSKSLTLRLSLHSNSINDVIDINDDFDINTNEYNISDSDDEIKMDMDIDTNTTKHLKYKSMFNSLSKKYDLLKQKMLQNEETIKQKGFNNNKTINIQTKIIYTKYICGCISICNAIYIECESESCT